MFGVGDKSSYEYGALTQEGLAVYTQNQFGQPSFPNLDIPVHNFMKYFIELDKILPMGNLVDREMTQKLVFSSSKTPGNEATVWMSYIQAGSFVTYLIDEYGLDKFAEIYNQPDLEQKLEQIYNKDLKNLEEEWLVYINKNYKAPSQEKINSQLQYYNDAIEQIDNSIFIPAD
ncbi:hypothetical protein [Cytobacillus gottheilii]|uniref:hypothetical protein n=1 Tax=Cytobacillus gottheilii TaxID=859144 RepID=UPI001593F474|nr:hypothetical protein [Cytobacillus gottheilii]